MDARIKSAHDKTIIQPVNMAAKKRKRPGYRGAPSDR
jgi:hypothetical protein